MKPKRISYLEYFRRTKELKQTEFAKAIGVSQGTLSKMETFRLPVSAAVLKSLRLKYKVNINKCLEQDTFEKKGWILKKVNKEEILEEAPEDETFHHSPAVDLTESLDKAFDNLMGNQEEGTDGQV